MSASASSFRFDHATLAPRETNANGVTINLYGKTALLDFVSRVMKAKGTTFDWGWGRTEKGVETILLEPAKIPFGAHGTFGDFATLKSLAVHPHDGEHPLHVDVALNAR